MRTRTGLHFGIHREPSRDIANGKMVTWYLCFYSWPEIIFRILKVCLSRHGPPEMEWVRWAEEDEKGVHRVHLSNEGGRGREGGISLAARELPIPGKSEAAKLHHGRTSLTRSTTASRCTSACSLRRDMVVIENQVARIATLKEPERFTLSTAKVSSRSERTVQMMANAALPSSSARCQGGRFVV